MSRTEFRWLQYEPMVLGGIYKTRNPDLQFRTSAYTITGISWSDWETVPWTPMIPVADWYKKGNSSEKQ